MVFRLLGPLTVGGSPASGGPRVRALLALLLLDAGHVVAVERLVDGLYGDDPPAGAANALQSQVSRLRRAGLPDGVAVEHSPAGDRLAGVAADDVDALRFARLAREGARLRAASGDAVRAEELLREALGLWRGPALADVRDAPYAAAQVARLDALRLDALEEWAAARLACGDDPAPLVRDLTEAATAHPLRERLRALQMRALAGAGRQAEALGVYEEVRGALAEELGADPSEELVSAHLAVLRGEASAPSANGSGQSANGPGRAENGQAPAANGSGQAANASARPASGAAEIRGGTGPGRRGGRSGHGPGPGTELPDRDGGDPDLGLDLGVGVGLGVGLGLGPGIGLVPDPGRDLDPGLGLVPGPGLGPGLGLAPGPGGRDLGPVPRTRVRPPLPLTAFVGRERERERLGALLSAARLVTLVGPGGAGKTRLAVECAGRDAVFVDLAAVGPGEAAGAFARALGVRDAGSDALVRALADRPVLLVVDNCEHVVAESALLVRELLTGCQELRVLATSREALGITGESLLPLAALAAGAAEELFVRRGAAARPGFTGHARVPEICAALDGLPLALELAAARLRTLTVDDLADRLGDRLAGPFRVLSRGDRTAPERHRTLAAVVQWSWELLDEEERVSAARFSVFRGGATIEAAAAVWGTDAADAADLLASLTEKSLMEATTDASGRSRYRMLETVRAYAAGQLPADDPAFAAHTAHFLALARATDPGLRGPDQLGLLARLDAEEPNLRTALRRASPEDGLRLVAALTSYWWLRGLRGQVAGPAAELLDAVEQAGLAPDSAGLGEEYALCVLIAGAAPAPGTGPGVAIGTGPGSGPGGAVAGPDTSTGQQRQPAPPPTARLVRARDLLVTRTEPLRQPFTAFLWATAVGPEERLPVPDDPWSRALDLVGQGHLALARGDRETAERTLTAALAGFRALGDRWGTATALEGLAGLSPNRCPCSPKPSASSSPWAWPRTSWTSSAAAPRSTRPRATRTPPPRTAPARRKPRAARASRPAAGAEGGGPAWPGRPAGLRGPADLTGPARRT
ncbi:BTAD domain-containing putative transcriptional regulator [Streptomyces roseicoloratus]|uniref:BTAD domain-containing putative transcriptional regulator n=1 Tax=Streptomyces roseicoloratus TaxID=2508722 RepID=A0ABY9RX87_9ACTN|nr:BTAD domain-containing putative transcriptional regulator [Streptomyces roseicoloratus]WMX46577.1 BTAD domain-containing putative transcriptional regulator [Streptomyces roseicoloratus]